MPNFARYSFFVRFLTYIVITGIYVLPYAWSGTIAWFYALDSEKAAFEETGGKPLRSSTSGSVVMHDYRVGLHRVIAAKMGSGCATTAATVATVLALNPADRLISTGPAGGLTKEAEPGTWLRVEEVIAWQKGRAGEGGKVQASASEPMKIAFEKSAWPGGVWEKAVPAKLVSGEAFVASNEVRSGLAAETGAWAVEMNAFGLLAATQGRPMKMLVLRIVSDRADDHASEDFAAFLKKDDGAGGRMVAEIVKSLPVEANEPAAHEALRELLK